MKHEGGRQKRVRAGGVGVAAAVVALLLGLLPAGFSLKAAAATSPPASRSLAYDLVAADGAVSSFGGAGNFGGVENISLRMPVVGMAVTPDGRGYWIVTANGSVYPKGDARFYGSPGRGPLPGPAHRIIAIVATNNGRGYWLCDASGVVRAYGDAPRLPSLARGKTRDRIVGFTVEPNERGAWVVTDKGVIWRLGAVRNYGGLGRLHLTNPIVTIARNTAGTGYWMLDSAGRVYSFGGTRRLTSVPPLVGPAVGLAVAPASLGFWGASAGGSVFGAGVAPLGSLSDIYQKPSGRLVVGIAAARPVPAPPAGYDVLQQNGAVSSFGGAGNFGGAQDLTLKGPAVDMAVTPDGRGYWIVTSNGSVYPYGDAYFYGSPGSGPPPAAGHNIVSIVPTADGQGYWLCDASGVVRAYGDARQLPSLPASYAGPPIVAFAVLPGEAGALAVDAAGDVYPLGRATSYGSLTGQTLAYPIVAMALTPDGRGYWLTDSEGDVYSFGDAASPVAPPSSLSGTVVGITGPKSGTGYWAVTTTGLVIPGGVTSRGGPYTPPPAPPVAAIATAIPLSSTELSPYPHGSVGYDVSWPQCPKKPNEAASLPGPPGDAAGSGPYSVAFVGVDGWAFGSDNACLSTEIAWAEQARLPGRSNPQYQLYTFLNSPPGVNSTDKTGPAGTCERLTATARPACYAYNYGFNSAVGALAYAASQGARAPVWWLDIENDSCSSAKWAGSAFWSCTPALNDRTIQGAIDALRRHRITVGVYSTALQWNIITDHFVPSGAQLPLWIAGAPWTSPPYPQSSGYGSTAALIPWCSGYHDFAGGVPSMLQETPGSNNYPFDPDVAC